MGSLQFVSCGFWHSLNVCHFLQYCLMYEHFLILTSSFVSKFLKICFLAPIHFDWVVQRRKTVTSRMELVPLLLIPRNDMKLYAGSWFHAVCTCSVDIPSHDVLRVSELATWQIKWSLVCSQRGFEFFKAHFGFSPIPSGSTLCAVLWSLMSEIYFVPESSKDNLWVF